MAFQGISAWINLIFVFRKRARKKGELLTFSYVFNRLFEAFPLFFPFLSICIIYHLISDGDSHYIRSDLLLFVFLLWLISNTVLQN